MKLLISLIALLFTATIYADTNMLMFGEFKPLSPSVKVEGKAGIFYVSESESEIVVLEDFRLMGAVVMDLKVCGDLFGDGSGNVCLSLGEPRNRDGKQTFYIPDHFAIFKHLLIFDLDLGSNLARASLVPLAK